MPEIVDFRNATPAPPSGYQDIGWQKGAQSGTDASTGYPIFPVSGNVPSTGGVSVKTANYTVTAADCGLLIVANSSSAIAFSLPPTSPFSKWQVQFANIGTGALTISPNSLQLDNATSSLTLSQNQGISISTDGTNYFSERGMGSGSSPSGPSGTYNINFGILGQPAGGSAILALFVFTEAVNFAADFLGSEAKVETNPTANQSWTLNKNGSGVGTVSISIAGAVTFSSSGAISFAAGDLLTLVGSASQDATLANVDIVLAGVRASVTSTPINVIPFSWIGQVGASQLLGIYTFTNAITFQANWAGAAAHCGANPSATWTATVYKNGSSVGTVSISTSGVFTFASTGGAPVSFAAGDVMTVIAPGFDPSLQNIAFSLSGSAGGYVQLGGDLGGSSTSPLVIGLQGHPISSTAPTDGQVPTWVAADSQYEPRTPSGTPSGGFPLTIVQEATYQSGTGNVTSFAVTFPSALAASGNTAFILVACDGSQTVTVPSGWTVDFNSQQSTYARLILIHKATAGDTSATFTVSSGSSFAAYFFEVSGSHTLDHFSTGGSANAAFVRLPAITPSMGTAVFGAACIVFGGTAAPIQCASNALSPWKTLGVSAGASSGARVLVGNVFTQAATGVSVTPPVLSFGNTPLFSSGGIAYASFSIL